MILDTEVKVMWNSNNKHIYIPKGYVFTKLNDTFLVKINDLSEGNSSLVNIQCDYCGKIYTKKYVTYIKQNKYSTINKDACKNCASLKVKESNMVKYGVENVFNVKEYKEKVKNTCMKKYGNENYLATEDAKKKIKETFLREYGVENPFQIEEIKTKIVEINIKKYGVSSYTKTQECQDKKRKTNLKRYNVTVPSKNKKVLEKMKKTTKERYGVEHYTKTKRYKINLIQSNLKKYGVEYYTQTEEFANKLRDKWNSKTDKEKKEIREKAKVTMIKRYGVPHSMQSEKLRKKAMETMKKNGTVPTSKAQLKVYEMLKLRYNIELNYPYNNYFLDVALFYDNIKIDIEYDGWYWHKNRQNEDKYRNEFLKSKGWKVLRIIGMDNPPTLEQLLNAIEQLLNTDRQFKQIYVEQDIKELGVI